jgi:predicted amidohydrolase
VRLAVCQFEPRLGAVTENLTRLAHRLEDALARGAELVLFPEAALSGYGFEDRAAAAAAARRQDDAAFAQLARILAGHGERHALVGFAERDGDRLFNSAALIGSQGIAGVYRKTHLLHLGLDRFTRQGDRGLPVFTLPAGRIAPQICFDLGIPEVARSQKLAGAQLLCVPTNWPLEAEISCDLAPRVRAQENHVFVATCDRVGSESGCEFRGRSRIIDFEGRVVAEASAQGEDTLLATLDLAAADRNRVVYRAGEYELDRIAARRPELYAALVRPIANERSERRG